MFKKTLITCLFLIVYSIILIGSSFNEEYCVPNSIILAFNAKSINSTIGDITVSATNLGQIQIGVPSFDSLAVMFNFSSIERLFKPKKPRLEKFQGCIPYEYL